MNFALLSLLTFFLVSCSSVQYEKDFATFDKDGNVMVGNKNIKSLVDRNGVRETVSSAAEELRNCYHQELKLNAEARGRMKVNFEVVLDAVSSIKTLENEGNFSEEMLACVKKSLSSRKYPKAPEGTTYEVTYPFMFRKN